MNNLKRILSLALASVMLVGMMVVGASATDYVDDEKIVNKEAVETLGALGIMNGDERGFRPEDGLTRAEAAKMLAKVHNKGVDVNFGAKTDPTFTDIKGHWAENNIEYAAAFGIANGKGNGIFDPQGSLTVVQWARMILNMMGYTEGQTGSDWELQTTVLANNVGLFEGLSIIPTNNVTRDQAAQVLVNAIYKPMVNGVVTQSTVYRLANKPNETDVPDALLAMEFETATDAAAVAESYGLTGKYLINKDTQNTTESLGNKYLSISEAHGVVRSVSVIASGANKGKYTLTTATAGSFTVATDYSKYIGEDVQILFKGGNKNAVYGVFPISTVVYEGTVGAYQGLVAADNRNGATINGLTVLSQTAADLGTLAEVDKAFKIKAVDTTGNGVADTLTAEASTYGAISFIGNTTVNIANAGTLTLANIDMYEGAKVGDYAIVTATANGTKVTKAEVITGTITSLNNAGSARIGGTWYPAGNTPLTNAVIGDDYDLVLVNGYYVVATEAQENEAASTDLFYLLKVVKQQNGLDADSQLARVLTLEGKTQDVTLSATTDNLVGNDQGASAINKFYTYKRESNGTYTLKLANNTDNKAGYNTVNTNVKAGVTAATSRAPAKVGTLNLADDALVLVAYKTNTTPAADKFEVLTGKDVKTWGSDWGDAASTVAFSNTINGISYVKLLFLADADATTLPNAGATSNGGYGYVVSSETTFELVNNTTVAVYTIWNGTANVEVKDTVAAAKAAGSIISYTENADGTITSAAADEKIGAVTGWSTADKLVNITKLDGTEDSDVSSINDYTTILYVDTAKKTGSEGGAAEPMATKLDTGAYVPNVYYVTGDNGVLELLVVDTTNKIAGTQANTDLSAEMIKKLATGTYLGTALGNVADEVSSEDSKYLAFFVFKAPKATAQYTLTVTAPNGDEIYTESTADPSTYEANSTHYFVMDLRPGYNCGPDADTEMPTGRYSWTVTYTDGETKTAGTGSFSYTAPAAN